MELKPDWLLWDAAKTFEARGKLTMLKGVGEIVETKFHPAYSGPAYRVRFPNGTGAWIPINERTEE